MWLKRLFVFIFRWWHRCFDDDVEKKRITFYSINHSSAAKPLNSNATIPLALEYFYSSLSSISIHAMVYATWNHYPLKFAIRRDTYILPFPLRMRHGAHSFCTQNIPERPKVYHKRIRWIRSNGAVRDMNTFSLENKCTFGRAHGFSRKEYAQTSISYCCAALHIKKTKRKVYFVRFSVRLLFRFWQFSIGITSNSTNSQMKY